MGGIGKGSKVGVEKAETRRHKSNLRGLCIPPSRFFFNPISSGVGAG